MTMGSGTDAGTLDAFLQESHDTILATAEAPYPRGAFMLGQKDAVLGVAPASRAESETSQPAAGACPRYARQASFRCPNCSGDISGASLEHVPGHQGPVCVALMPRSNRCDTNVRELARFGAIRPESMPLGNIRDRKGPPEAPCDNSAAKPDRPASHG